MTGSIRTLVTEREWGETEAILKDQKYWSKNPIAQFQMIPPPSWTLERYVTQAEQTISKPVVVAERVHLFIINSKEIYTANHK